MKRSFYVVLALGFSLSVPALAAEKTSKTEPGAAPVQNEAPAKPARKIRRVTKFSQMKIKGRANRPNVDVIVERYRLRFVPGTIRYSYQRQSFERFD